jgi:3-oxoacid CoA-transferase subunit A
VAIGDLDPDHIVTPGIFVDRILEGAAYEKRIERVTTRPRAELDAAAKESV